MALTAGQVEVLFRARDQISGVLGKVRGSLERTGGRLDSVRQKLKQISAATFAMSASVAGAIGGSAFTFQRFERAMNRVAAVSGATGQQLAQMTALAKELGSTTAFSAKEAADGMGFLAQAGFSVNEVMAAMPGVLQLASAGQIELGRAADITSNVLSGYGFAATEVGRVNDVLVKTFTSSNTSLETLGDTFSYVAPLAKASGLEFEELSAAIGIMGDAGVQGSRAGTALRGAIGKLLKPTEEGAAIMERLGLDVTDAHGKMIPFADIIEKLGPIAGDTASLIELFGQEAVGGMAPVVQAGAERIREFRDELRDAGGTAERVEQQQLEGLTGVWTELKSAAEGISIEIGQRFKPILIDAGNAALRVIRIFRSQVLPVWDRLSPKVQKVITGFGLLLAVLSPLAAGLAAVVGVVGAVTASLPAFAGAMAAAAGAAKGMSLALLTPPLGLVVAVGALVAALALWVDHQNQVETKLERFKGQASDAAARIADLRARQDDLTDGERRLLVELESHAAALDRQIESMSELGDEAEFVGPVIREIADASSDAAGETDGLTDSFQESESAAEALRAELERLQERLDAGTATGPGFSPEDILAMDIARTNAGGAGAAVPALGTLGDRALFDAHPLVALREQLQGLTVDFEANEKTVIDWSGAFQRAFEGGGDALGGFTSGILQTLDGVLDRVTTRLSGMPGIMGQLGNLAGGALTAGISTAVQFGLSALSKWIDGWWKGEEKRVNDFRDFMHSVVDELVAGDLPAARAASIARMNEDEQQAALEHYRYMEDLAQTFRDAGLSADEALAWERRRLAATTATEIAALYSELEDVGEAARMNRLRDELLGLPTQQVIDDFNELVDVWESMSPDQQAQAMGNYADELWRAHEAGVELTDSQMEIAVTSDLAADAMEDAGDAAETMASKYYDATTTLDDAIARVADIDAEIADIDRRLETMALDRRADALKDQLKTINDDAQAASDAVREIFASQFDALDAEMGAVRLSAREKITALQEEAELARTTARERIDALEEQDRIAQENARRRLEEIDDQLAAARKLTLDTEAIADLRDKYGLDHRFAGDAFRAQFAAEQQQALIDDLSTLQSGGATVEQLASSPQLQFAIMNAVRAALDSGVTVDESLRPFLDAIARRSPDDAAVIEQVQFGSGLTDAMEEQAALVESLTSERETVERTLEETIAANRRRREQIEAELTATLSRIKAERTAVEDGLRFDIDRIRAERIALEDDMNAQLDVIEQNRAAAEASINTELEAIEARRSEIEDEQYNAEVDRLNLKRGQLEEERGILQGLIDLGQQINAAGDTLLADIERQRRAAAPARQATPRASTAATDAADTVPAIDLDDLSPVISQSNMRKLEWIQSGKGEWGAKTQAERDAEVSKRLSWYVDVPEVEVPHLAAGGIVTKPTLAMLGESGDEAVVPLSASGPSRVERDLRELVDELRADRAAGGGGGRMVPAKLLLKHRGIRELAEVVAEELPGGAHRSGGSSV